MDLMFPFWNAQREKVNNILESLAESDNRADREFCLVDEPRRVLEDVARKRGVTNPTAHRKEVLIKIILDTYE